MGRIRLFRIQQESDPKISLDPYAAVAFKVIILVLVTSGLSKRPILTKSVHHPIDAFRLNNKVSLRTAKFAATLLN